MNEINQYPHDLEAQNIFSFKHLLEIQKAVYMYLKDKDPEAIPYLEKNFAKMSQDLDQLERKLLEIKQGGIYILPGTDNIKVNMRDGSISFLNAEYVSFMDENSQITEIEYLINFDELLKIQNAVYAYLQNRDTDSVIYLQKAFDKMMGHKDQIKEKLKQITEQGIYVLPGTNNIKVNMHDSSISFLNAEYVPFMDEFYNYNL